MLSRLPRKEAVALLERCDRRAITRSTTWRLNDLIRKIEISAARGYATAFEEIHHGDLSVAAAVVDGEGRPVGAINIASLRSRMTPADLEAAYAALVVDTARLISLRT
jgi:DNA-binding IclR family transcriptional regulator